MGNMPWKRHIIINVQPGAKGIDDAVKYLQQKPVREQGQERLSMELTRLREMAITAEDKVYLVGHGGEGTLAGTLGGMHAVALAAHVTTPLKDVGQINLIMCGGGDPTLSGAKNFKKTIEEWGCSATVYAYTASLKVANDGRKYAVDFDESGPVPAFCASEEVRKTD
jgi:hypothetical protein